jgi:HAD superfamily hydrolase (TIGR01509 family)
VRGSRAFELVVFDCDGVLVDSERLSIRLDVELLAALGWPMTEAEIVEHFVGRTDAAMRAEIEEHLGRDVSAEWDAFAERYLAAFAAELEPVDGVAAAVDAIQDAGYGTCVASSGDHGKIRRNLAKQGGKPAPDLFLHAAAAMGVEPARAAVVEDSRHGVEAARAAGMWVFAYTSGVTPAAALAGARTMLFAEMRSLPALIETVEPGA